MSKLLAKSMLLLGLPPLSHEMSKRLKYIIVFIIKFCQYGLTKGVQKCLTSSLSGFKWEIIYRHLVYFQIVHLLSPSDPLLSQIDQFASVM
jgi:hypothetical protein